MSDVTLKDIAEEAGVSVTTVSRALNDKKDICPHTKERVLNIVNNMHYSPNAVARGLKLRRTRTIGAVISDISDPFFAPIVRGIEHTARHGGYNLIICDSNEDYETEKDELHTLMEQRVEGLLITPTQTRSEDIVRLKTRKIPFVLLCRHFDLEGLETDYVSTDDIKGAFSATKYLIERGHRKILFINGPTYVSSAKERLAGYKQASFEAGVVIDESLIREGAITMEHGYRNMKNALKECPRFTAVFAYSDFVALGITQALREADLRIPQDIAVVGYDDIDISSFLEVPLTTVRVPKYDLGVAGFKLLARRLTGKVNYPQRVILPTELIIRKSA